MPSVMAEQIPFITFSRLPHLVIFLNFSGLRLSKDTLILSIPFFFKMGEYFSKLVPFVVKVCSKILFCFFNSNKCSITEIIFFLTKGSPPVSLNFLTPNSLKTSINFMISSIVKTSCLGKKVTSSAIQ